MTQRLFSTSQVAELLGTSPARVSEWIEKGWLPGRQYSDGPIRISEGELAEFLRRRGDDGTCVFGGAPATVPRLGAAIAPSATVPRTGTAANHAAVTPEREAPSLPQEAEPVTGRESPSHAQPAPPKGAQIAEAILADAVGRGATAIHLAGRGEDLSLRLRIHGVMHEKPAFRDRLPAGAGAEVVEHLRFMAGLNGAIGATAEEGRFGRSIGGRTVPFRLVSSPVRGGRKLVVHVEAEARPPELQDIGLPPGRRAQLRELLAESTGIILLVAPRRIERTATLTAMVRAANARWRSVAAVAAEPLEVDGVACALLDGDAGDDYADAIAVLRRQDADVIAVDELPDPAAGASVVAAAGDGRLVLAGVTDRSAGGAIAGLYRNARHPNELGRLLLAAIEQRTVRRLCPACRTATTADADMLVRAGLDKPDFDLFAPGGCAECGRLGYVGTTGLFAVTEFGPELSAAIGRDATPASLARTAASLGDGALTDATITALREGVTSLAEVVRVMPRRRTGPWARV